MKLDLFNIKQIFCSHFGYDQHGNILYTLITRETYATFPCMKSFVIGKMKNSKRDSRVMVRSFLSVAYLFAEFAADRRSLAATEDAATEKFSYCGEPERCVSWTGDFGSTKNDRNFILDMQGMRLACIGCLIKIAVFRHECFTTLSLCSATYCVSRGYSVPDGSLEIGSSLMNDGKTSRDSKYFSIVLTHNG